MTGWGRRRSPLIPDMNVIRETVRVVKEEIEKDPELKKKLYDKYHSALNQPIGQTVISEFLGGPWKREYQQNLIAEALAKMGLL